jgi:hypothetical protein
MVADVSRFVQSCAHAENEPNVLTSAVRPAKQLGGGCAVLFGLPFIVAGLAVGWFLYFPVISTWWSARGWEEVPCWIENAEMKASPRQQRRHHLQDAGELPLPIRGSHVSQRER